MLEHALKYLKKGYSVIPVGQNKVPLVSWIEFQQRKATEDEITKWWTDHPDANIGIVTGKISNLLVVDIEKGGDVSYLPTTLISRTGGGGWHYYYLYTEGVGNKARIKPLTDIRGEGGYVVAPPSMHASGTPYSWGVECEMAPFPKELFEIKKVNDWEKIMDGTPSGSRNETAATLFGKLMRAFDRTLWESVVWKMGIEWNAKNNPPLTEAELRSVFNSIAKRAVNDHEPEKKEVDTTTVESLTFSDVVNLGYRELVNTNPADVISFGYKKLDEALTGIFPGEMVVVGGETGMGKTTFCTNIIYRASAHVKCGVYALEDRLEDYGIKSLFFKLNQILKKEEGIFKSYSWNDFRCNRLTDDKFVRRLVQAKKALANDNIMFANVKGDMNIDLLEKLIEKQTSEGVGLFLIDHLHYFDLHSKDMSKADYIEKIMIRLRTLQRRTGARIVLVVHYRKLNKQKPDLNSFKDSISIVQNANYVINIGRDRSEKAIQDKKKDRMKLGDEKTFFYIPKARNPNGENVIEMYFKADIGDYTEEVTSPTPPQSPRTSA